MKFNALPDDETIEKACKDTNLNYGEITSNNSDSGSVGKSLSSLENGSQGATEVSLAPKYSNEWIDRNGMTQMVLRPMCLRLSGIIMIKVGG